MVDPDAPSPDNPTMAQWLHWIVANIPGGCSRISLSAGILSAESILSVGTRCAPSQQLLHQALHKCCPAHIPQSMQQSWTVPIICELSMAPIHVDCAALLDLQEVTDQKATRLCPMQGPPHLVALTDTSSSCMSRLVAPGAAEFDWDDPIWFQTRSDCVDHHVWGQGRGEWGQGTCALHS